MMRGWRWILLLMCVFCAVGLVTESEAKDDLVILKNGDRISGTIRGMESDQLEVATGYAGTIKIDWGEIQHLQPAEPISVTVHQDVKIPAGVGTRDGDHVIIKELSAKGPLRLEHIKAIGVGTTYQRGNINLGGNHTTGNSNTSALNAAGTYILRKEWHRLQINGKFNRGENNGQLSAENGSFSMAYDYLLSRRTFLSGRLLEENDRFQELTLRSTATFSLGHYFYDRGKRSLSIGAGPGLVYEKFRPIPSTVKPAASWFAHWYQTLPGGQVSLFHDHQGYRDLDDRGATRLDAQQGIRVNVYGNIALNFEYDIRYNSKPVAGRKTVDSSLILGLSYGFEK